MRNDIQTMQVHRRAIDFKKTKSKILVNYSAKSIQNKNVNL